MLPPVLNCSDASPVLMSAGSPVKLTLVIPVQLVKPKLWSRPETDVRLNVVPAGGSTRPMLTSNVCPASNPSTEKPLSDAPLMFGTRPSDAGTRTRRPDPASLLVAPRTRSSLRSSLPLLAVVRVKDPPGSAALSATEKPDPGTIRTLKSPATGFA